MPWLSRGAEVGRVMVGAWVGGLHPKALRCGRLDAGQVGGAAYFLPAGAACPQPGRFDYNPRISEERCDGRAMPPPGSDIEEPRSPDPPDPGGAQTSDGIPEPRS